MNESLLWASHPLQIQRLADAHCHSCKHDSFLLPWGKQKVTMVLFPGRPSKNLTHTSPVEVNQSEDCFKTLQVFPVLRVICNRHSLNGSWCQRLTLGQVRSRPHYWNLEIHWWRNLLEAFLLEPLTHRNPSSFLCSVTRDKSSDCIMTHKCRSESDRSCIVINSVVNRYSSPKISQWS